MKTYRTLSFTTIAIAFALFFAFVVPSHAAKNIEVEFEYPGVAESFKLYMDGAVIYTDVKTGVMTWQRHSH